MDAVKSVLCGQNPLLRFKDAKALKPESHPCRVHGSVGSRDPSRDAVSDCGGDRWWTLESYGSALIMPK